ncbi:MAG TPA: hypothetical protein VGM31_14530 [Puia sp.]|jgi:hypothetical protein
MDNTICAKRDEGKMIKVTSIDPTDYDNIDLSKEFSVHERWEFLHYYQMFVNDFFQSYPLPISRKLTARLLAIPFSPQKLSSIGYLSTLSVFHNRLFGLIKLTDIIDSSLAIDLFLNNEHTLKLKTDQKIIRRLQKRFGFPVTGSFLPQYLTKKHKAEPIYFVQKFLVFADHAKPSLKEIYDPKSIIAGNIILPPTMPNPIKTFLYMQRFIEASWLLKLRLLQLDDQ